MKASQMLTYIYHDCLRTLHSRAVVEAKTNFVPNRVLGASPPDMSPLECLLPRSVRTTLSQLRSSHCRLLNSYKAHITSGISDVCPECGVAAHSIEHLFHCQSHPTQLTVQDLWDNPAAVTVWNNLPEYLRDPELSIDNFRRQLKTFLFAQYWRWHPSALKTLVPVRSINLLFTLFTFTLLPQPGQLTIGDDLLGYHNNNNNNLDLTLIQPASKWIYWATLRHHSDLLGAATSDSSQAIPILDKKSLLTVLLRFVCRQPGPLLNPEPPSATPVEVCGGEKWNPSFNFAIMSVSVHRF